MPTISKNRAPELNRYQRRAAAARGLANRKAFKIKMYRKAKRIRILAEREAKKEAEAA